MNANPPKVSAGAGPSTRAAIDIGTNSIHLVVARVDGVRLDIITREKESVRLGDGSGEMSKLNPDAIDRGIETLRRFRQVADSASASISAVATSAVREATNRATFINRARDEAGIDVQVISGTEEARLIHLGVLQAVPVFDRQHLVIDIGGGSTEFVLAKGARVYIGRSLKLGAIRLTNRFFPDGIVTAKAVKACRDYVRSYLVPVAREIVDRGFDVAVGSSGTINAIADIVATDNGREQGRSLNNMTFSRDELGLVIERLLAARSSSERAKIPGLDTKRNDIIVAGALLLEQIFDHIGIDSMITSEYALREGVLLDVAHDGNPQALHHLSDIRRESVQRVVNAFERDLSHAEHSTDLALQLFDQTANLHELTHDTRDHLEAAGMMHNVGLFISHSSHHKHSFYIIRNSDMLVGFTDHELELMALVARYHRKAAPSPKHLDFAALDPADRRTVQLLAGMLRIGIALDRSHAQRVQEIRVHHLDQKLTITPLTVAAADISLEMYTANERKELLASALGAAIAFAPPQTTDA